MDGSTARATQQELTLHAARLLTVGLALWGATTTAQEPAAVSEAIDVVVVGVDVVVTETQLRYTMLDQLGIIGKADKRTHFSWHPAGGWGVGQRKENPGASPRGGVGWW